MPKAESCSRCRNRFRFCGRPGGNGNPKCIWRTAACPPCQLAHRACDHTPEERALFRAHGRDGLGMVAARPPPPAARPRVRKAPPAGHAPGSPGRGGPTAAVKRRATVKRIQMEEEADVADALLGMAALDERPPRQGSGVHDRSSKGTATTAAAAAGGGGGGGFAGACSPPTPAANAAAAALTAAEAVTAAASAPAAAAAAAAEAGVAGPPSGRAANAAAAEVVLVMMAHDGIWNVGQWLWLEETSRGRVRVLVHLDAKADLSDSAWGGAARGFLRGRLLPTRADASWGRLSLLEASVGAAAEALRACPGAHTAYLVSGSCLPLVDGAALADALTPRRRAAADAGVAPSLMPLMVRPRDKTLAAAKTALEAAGHAALAADLRVTHQWCALSRPAAAALRARWAEARAADALLAPLLRPGLAPDEYLPFTMLQRWGMLAGGAARAAVCTAVAFQLDDSKHPVTFRDLDAKLPWVDARGAPRAPESLRQLLRRVLDANARLLQRGGGGGAPRRGPQQGRVLPTLFLRKVCLGDGAQRSELAEMLGACAAE